MPVGMPKTKDRMTELNSSNCLIFSSCVPELLFLILKITYIVINQPYPIKI